MPDYDCIMVAPQIGTDSQWVNTPWADGSYDLSETPESASMQAVEELLEKLCGDYRVDRDRLYLVGISMGGYGVWDMAMRSPDLFAAAVPICGAATRRRRRS